MLKLCILKVINNFSFNGSFLQTLILLYITNHSGFFIQTVLLPFCLLFTFIFSSQLLCYTMFICQDTEKGQTVRHNIGYSLCEDLCCPPGDFLLSF